MKIVELRAENIKRLTAVSIRPDGNLVEITGKNGHGKTSVLDSMWWALEGQKNIQTTPIRRGATEARVRLDLGELIVTRTFRAREGGDYTTSITVEKADGARFPSPQKMLDDLLGELAFDPLAFTRMKPTDQLETLKRFVPGVDFAAIKSANEADYQKRTSANKRAKELRAQAAGVSISTDPIPDKIDESALISELDDAGKKNTDLEQRKARREQLRNDIAKWREESDANMRRIKVLEQQIAELLSGAKQTDAAADRAGERLRAAEPLSEPIDTTDIRRRIAAARDTNKKIEAETAARQTRESLTKQAEEHERQSATLTAAMQDREKKKEAAISAHSMPIEGLSFGDGHVLMAGVPFDQASDAEQLRASIAIAAAMNPKLRVIRVRDGSLLDEDAMKLLAEFADQHDMQIWVERVDGSGRIGFVIEDGHIKEMQQAAE